MKLAYGICLVFLSLILITKCEDFQCIDGVSYVENNCNDCSCSKGFLQCTYKACFSDNNGIENKCQSGTTWKENCNQCWCTDLYGTLCTNNEC